MLRHVLSSKCCNSACSWSREGAVVCSGEPCSLASISIVGVWLSPVMRHHCAPSYMDCGSNRISEISAPPAAKRWIGEMLSMKSVIVSDAGEK